jgi:hypothetical protein
VIDLRGLPSRTVTVKIKLTGRRGRVLTGARRYRTCRPKPPQRTIPPL